MSNDFGMTIADINETAVGIVMDEICKVSDMFISILETGDGDERATIVADIEQRMLQVLDDIEDFRPIMSREQHELLKAMAAANADSLSELGDLV